MLTAALVALVATTAAPPSWSDLNRARIELLLAVSGRNRDGTTENVNPEGVIPQYAWDDPTELLRTYTRRELVDHLVAMNNQAVESGAPGLSVDVEEILAAINISQTLSKDDWGSWTGIHEAEDRAAEFPDDANWYNVGKLSQNAPAFQIVEWFGLNPRIGFNTQDTLGLWGYDPKRSENDEVTIEKIRARVRLTREKLPIQSPPDHRHLTDDGQGGYLGVNVGFAFTPDDPAWHGILWISFKEAYLEFVHRETGQRIAQGMKGQRYVWNIRR